MVSKKTLRFDHIMYVLFNEDSKNYLIPDFDSGESNDSEGLQSPEISMISGLNADIQNTDVIIICEIN